MVVYSCRMSQKKRGTKRRRSGVPVVVTRRSRRTRPARVFRRGGCQRPQVMSSASAFAFYYASRWHHAPDLGVPDQLSSCAPIKGVTHKAVTAPTGLGAAYYIFCWTPSHVRCMWISHQLDYDTGYYHIHFPFLASHTQAAGASMIWPLRQSVSLRNIAASQDVNGYFRVLHTNHPMNFAVEDVTNDQTARMRISSANHSAFREMTDQHPQTRTVTNTELRVGAPIPIVPGTIHSFGRFCW